MNKIKKKYSHLNLFEDKKGRSKSFYLKDPYKKNDHLIIEFLKDYSKENENSDVRVCIHETENCIHHDMILLQNSKNYYTPHKHKLVGDTLYLIEGKLACFLYSNKGEITYTCTLKRGEILKIKKNVYHNFLPITKRVIYYEAKSGPFIREHTVIPNWCPKENDSNENIEKYKNFLLNNRKTN